MIENFAALSEKEQRDFAEALIKTINSEGIFTSNAKFKIDNVEADELTGDLVIECTTEEPLEVSRDAEWSCSDEEDAAEDPGYDVRYVEFSIFQEVENTFKTLSATIDGYKITLTVSDVDENETVEVKVDNIYHEDAGIGSYEYWGEVGYDSQPYVRVEGTLVKACDCAFAFFVEPINEPVDTVPKETEEN